MTPRTPGHQSLKKFLLILQQWKQDGCEQDQATNLQEIQDENADPLTSWSRVLLAPETDWAGGEDTRMQASL